MARHAKTAITISDLGLSIQWTDGLYALVWRSDVRDVDQ
jgi:hypothetical protein